MRINYRFTTLFTLIGFAVCALHLLGFDPQHMILLSLSVPLWFVHVFVDIRDLPILWAYALTIASWAMMGYVVDYFVHRYSAKR